MRKQFDIEGTPFDDLLDEITEVRRNAATSSDTRLESRVARLERIVERMLLELVEANQRP
jgi:hypothetical protein